MSTVTMHVGDVRDVMAGLPDRGFDLLVTSPPFLALRSYLPADHPDKHREIGSEATPAAFLDTLYGLTADWGRLLPEWASICVELGDTMSGAGGYGSPDSVNPAYNGERFAERWEGRTAKRFKRKDDGWPLAKSMCLIPHAYTLGLAYGHNPLTGLEHPAGQWRVRNVVTWARPNPPVGSLGRRNPERRTGDYKFRPACSYITVACRGTGRYFDLDAVRVEYLHPNHPQLGKDAVGTKADGRGNWGTFPRTRTENPAGAPPLDWHTDQLDGDWLWKLATAPYPGAHYATYPLTLPRRLILAMCPLEVCRGCGWPRERVVDKPTEQRSRHYAFASMLREHRQRVGLSQRDVDAAFGFNGMCSHWERQTEGALAQPAFPTPEQWRRLRDLLLIQTTEFDDDVHAESRRWTDRQHSPEYAAAIAHTRAEGFYVSKGNDGMARSGVNGRSMKAEYDTLGWTDCGHDAWQPGHVLDPFAGSGTTAVAAALESRDCTLIDLDPRNVDLVHRRLAEVCRIHDRTTTGTTTRWTVEPESAKVLAAVASGQLELFGASHA